MATLQAAMRRLLSTPATLALLLFPIGMNALEQMYCSSQNTGSNYSPVNSNYQSNGFCHDNCMANYAFAIVQGKNCWCSNYIPSSQIAVSNCNEPCPGYGQFEQCGDETRNLFGYVALGNVAPSSSVSPPTTSLRSSVTTAAIIPVTSIRNSPTPSPTPIVTTQVITLSGSFVTLTVTSTPTAYSDAGNSSNAGLAPGAIAGIVIGVLALFVIIGALIFMFWRRRGTQNAASGANGPQRNTSKLSRTGLLSRGRVPSMNERNNDDPFGLYESNGGASARHSMMFGGTGNDNVVVQPASPLGSSRGGSRDANDMPRRNTGGRTYDQRLNPSALYMNDEANGSRVSMQDASDYSRPLGVVNPDPHRPSFESRISHN